MKSNELAVRVQVEEVTFWAGVQLSMRGPETTTMSLEVGTQWKSCRNSAGGDGEVGTGLRCTEEETDRDWCWNGEGGTRDGAQMSDREVGGGGLLLAWRAGKSRLREVLGSVGPCPNSGPREDDLAGVRVGGVVRVMGS